MKTKLWTAVFSACVLGARLALCGVAAAHALVSAVAAEAGVVRGVVVNAATKARLQGAEVVLVSTDAARTLMTSTETDGSFRFPEVPPGDYELRVTYLGLDEVRQPLRVGGPSWQGEIAMTSQIYKLGAYVVAGEREGSALAITQQREAVNVKNVVASDTYGALIDGNIGTMLQRLPGVAGFVVGGDVRTVTVRGISEELNAVTVNGTRLPSAEATSTGREFSFENVSADSFETIEVVKAPTPEMDADSIGGAINLVSKNAFSYGGRRVRIAAGASYNDLAGDRVYPTGSINLSDIYGSRKQFGLSFNLGYSEHHAVNAGPIQQFEARAELPVYEWQIQLRNPTGGTRQRYSSGLKLDWKQSERSSFGVNLLYNYFEEARNSVPRILILQAPQTLAVIGANGALSGGAILPNYSATITEARPTNTTLARMNVNAAARTGVTWQVQPNAKHSFGPWTIDYDGSYASGRQRRGLNSRHGKGDANVQLANIGWRIDRSNSLHLPQVSQTAGPDLYDYSNYVWNGNYVEQERLGDDTIHGGQLNVKRNFEAPVPSTLKAGVRFRAQERTIDWYGERVYGFVGPTSKLADLKVEGGGTDPMGRYRMPNYWPDLVKIAASVRNEPQFWQENLYQSTSRNLSTDGTLNEDVLGYYLQGQTRLGRMTILGGVRVEETSVKGVGALQDATVTATTHPDPVQRALAEWGQTTRRSSDYRNVFPGVHFVYRARSGVVGRASYSTSIGRPAFGTLMPTANANEDSQVLTINNTGLRPQESDNFDAGAEYYFEPIGMLSANVFLKEIRQFIFSTRGQTIGAGPNNGFGGDYEGWELRSQANGGSARVRGMELNYQQQFSFLPGALRGFGVFANYTRLETKGDYGTAREQSGNEVAGFIPKTMNAGFTYHYQRWNSRVQWNHRGKYLFFFAESALARRYFEPVDYVDINVQFRLTRWLELYANVNNLFDEPRKEIAYDEQRPRAYFWSGTRYNLGVNARF
jgi:iron complex outermembrane receptor protein